MRKIFSPATVIRTPERTNQNTGEDRDANSVAVRYTKPDLVQSLYHRNHSSEHLTEPLAMLCSQSEVSPTEGLSEGPPEGAPIRFAANYNILIEDPDPPPHQGKPLCICHLLVVYKLL